MANDTTLNPIYADATGTLWTGQIKIRAIYWTGMTSNDDLILTDSNDKNVWIAKGVGGNDQKVENVGVVEGLKVATIDSGKVLVYHGG